MCLLVASTVASCCIRPFCYFTGWMRNTKYKNLESFWGRGDKKCRSVPAPFLGTLFVYKNNFWSKSQSALNITHFDMKQLATWQFSNLNVHPCSWAVGSNVLGSVEGFWRGHLQISRVSCRFLPESWTERRLTPSRSWWRPGFFSVGTTIFGLRAEEMGGTIPRT